MTNKLEFVLTKIREECPELRELSFGCEVKIKKEDTFYEGKGFRRITVVTFDDEKVVEFETTIGKRYKLEDIAEVYGLPIQLEHLLRALGEFQDENGWKVFVELFQPNELFIYLSNDIDQQGQVFYDLTKSVTENLETNSDLTDFLYSLFNQE